MRTRGQGVTCLLACCLQALPHLSKLHFLGGARFVDTADLAAALVQLPLADADKFPRWS